jgi:hydroxymethylglutaryl-CoA lyase
VVLEQLPPEVTLYEVSPRDGLQNEARLIPMTDKVALIDALSDTGLPAIEITSFVNPKWIPQLADAVEVASRIKRKPGIVYSALVPNRQGLDSALKAGMKEIAVFLSASETHNKKNVNKTIAATLRMCSARSKPPAGETSTRSSGSTSTSRICPYWT